MNKNKTYISTFPLFEYVKANEVAWQTYDSLIEFSHDTNYEFTEEERNDGYDVNNKEMLAILANAKESVVFNPETDNCSGFEDIIEWSKGRDMLILVDKELLLCIAHCEKEKILSMVAYN